MLLKRLSQPSQRRQLSVVAACMVWLSLVDQVTAFSLLPKCMAPSARPWVQAHARAHAPRHAGCRFSTLSGPLWTRGRPGAHLRNAAREDEGSIPSQPSSRPSWALLKVQVKAWLAALQRRVLLWIVGWFPVTGTCTRVLEHWRAFVHVPQRRVGTFKFDGEQSSETDPRRCRVQA